MRPVRFDDAARTELLEEIRYYAGISPKLAERFVDEVRKATQLASEFPDMGAPYKYGTRRVFPRRFPFSIVYVTHESEVYVVAVAPFRRKPGYWRSRSK